VLASRGMGDINPAKVPKGKKMAIKSLSPAEYAATTKAKRAGKAKGEQFVAQPKRIAQKTAGFR